MAAWPGPRFAVGGFIIPYGLQADRRKAGYGKSGHHCPGPFLVELVAVLGTEPIPKPGGGKVGPGTAENIKTFIYKTTPENAVLNEVPGQVFVGVALVHRNTRPPGQHKSGKIVGPKKNFIGINNNPFRPIESIIDERAKKQVS
jgi:hypothetical protein